MDAIPNNNQSQNKLPEHFDALKEGTTFTCDEDLVKQQIISILGPHGVKKLVFGDGSRTNPNEDTKQKFPHKRWSWCCGSCEMKVRKMDDSQPGCCGFKIRFLLEDKKADQQPYLEVKEFKLPQTSNHLLVSKEARQLSESKVIRSQQQLSPTKVSLLEDLGKNRASAEMARNLLSSQHGVTVCKNLLFRMMKQGRDKAWGASETDSLVIFCAEGMKLREQCDKYGVGGKFDFATHETTGKLIGWYAQYPLEVLNARAYAKDAVFVDTTHNATSYSFKTGPPAVIDCFGHSAPCGMFQVPEEEIDSVDAMMKVLELDVAGATCCTDGGTAWPEVAKMHHQFHLEDTWHNSDNGKKKAAKLSIKKDRDKFDQLKKKVLYSVLEQQELSDTFQEIRSLSTPNAVTDKGELERWIDRMEDGQTVRTATHTTKYFSCSEKGAASRCEQMMSKLKNSGTSNKEMKYWTLGELQFRHEQKVKSYETQVTEEMETAIKDRRVLSSYVLDWEAKERSRADGLEIVTSVEGVPNPFRLQSTKREMLTINLERWENGDEVGMTLEFCNNPAEEFRPNILITAIPEGSIYADSVLEVGMRIIEVNGKSFLTFNEGMQLLKSTEGQLNLNVEKSPSIGTIYTIQRKGKGEDKKMLRTVFIPDSEDLHCQSNYHVHTCSFIRCRYIQRALIDHKTRTMNDLSTIHSRWHLRNSPMYEIVYKSLVALMRIDGLGAAALPAFLTRPAMNPPECPTDSIADCANVDDDSVEEIPPKIVVPTSKARRYNEAMFVCKQIVELAKENMEVHRMVMPQLQQIYQNSLMMARSTGRAQNAKKQVAKSGASVPIAPDSLKKNRDKSDDINLANKRKKRRKVKKTQEKSQQHSENNEDTHVFGREDEKDDDDDNITLATLGRNK